MKKRGDMNIKQLFEGDERGYFKIARAAGLSPSVVWRVVNGRTRRPSMQTVAKLAAAFGVSVSSVIRAIKEQEDEN
jgi:transcriptional regulator with XRE-family HTH domain